MFYLVFAAEAGKWRRVLDHTDLELFQLAAKRMDSLPSNKKVKSQNIANSGTPGSRPKDLKR